MPDIVQLQATWGHVACQLFGRGKREYRLNAMYFEFANVASPGDPVTLPDVDRLDGLDYFTGLVGADFLRVPIRGEPGIEIVDGDEAAFPEAGTGNRLVFYAQTSGVEGVLGLPFSDAANSTVYGVHLVAAPDWGDRTKDVVFARGYYAADNQIPKRAGRHVAVTWEHDFT